MGRESAQYDATSPAFYVSQSYVAAAAAAATWKVDPGIPPSPQPRLMHTNVTLPSATFLGTLATHSVGATFQVFELGLFSALRNVLIGGPAERKAIASAGTATHLKPTPGRQGAILGCWELALTVG